MVMHLGSCADYLQLSSQQYLMLLRKTKSSPPNHIMHLAEHFLMSSIGQFKP